jgi:hypothetical protein
MLIEAITISGVVNAAKIISAILSILGLFYGVFKVINWVKTKLSSIDSNVVSLKTSIDSLIGGLRDDVKDQTQSLTNELREQRQDFRTFYSPILLMMQQQQQLQPAPVRAKRPPQKRVKKKTV